MKQLVEKWVEDVRLPETLDAAIELFQDLRAKYRDAIELRISVLDDCGEVSIYILRTETDEEEAERVATEARALAEQRKREAEALNGQETAIRQAIARLQNQLDVIQREKGETP